ncbi:hypothetical protein AVEN_146073-1 [Araneus ventricosus]|uniref:Uncharacterized protein n=1 Tax=Araneus ventricosus TaxID=182803 RepID=A0A4Y2VSA1_ARAVE|nr:hypothetical protein AVEN_146073-1 [Araneus ventricosus]
MSETCRPSTMCFNCDTTEQIPIERILTQHVFETPPFADYEQDEILNYDFSIHRNGKKELKTSNIAEMSSKLILLNFILMNVYSNHRTGCDYNDLRVHEYFRRYLHYFPMVHHFL